MQIHIKHNLFCRYFAVLLLGLLLFLFTSLPCRAVPSEPNPSAGAVCLYSQDADAILYEKNADLQIYPASTVKIMTGLLGCIRLADRLSENVVITQEMLHSGAGYRCLSLKVGDRVTVSDLLYGAICGGDTDACYAIAHLVSGSSAAFVQQMNQTAADFGANQTRYTNPTGIHDDFMVTTARDTLAIARHAAENALYMEISSAEQYTCSNQTKLANRNALVTSHPTSFYYDSRCRGLNTGSTTQGGYCLVTAADNGTYSYLCVIMQEAKENQQYLDASSLLDWAYATFGEVQIVKEGTVICSLPVTLSDEVKNLDLVTAGSYSGFFPKNVMDGDDLSLDYVTSVSKLEAPVREGQQGGFLTVTYQGKRLCAIPLVTNASAPKNAFLGALQQIRSLTAKRSFRAFLVCAFVLFSCYLTVLLILYRRKKKRRRKFY